MRSASLRATVLAAINSHGSRSPAYYAGAPLLRPIDSKLDDVEWAKSAERESAVILLDLNANAVGVDSSGHLAFASMAQAQSAGAGDTVLLGRRKAAAMPPSFLNPRYAKVASDAMVFATTIAEPSHATSVVPSIADFVGLRELVVCASAAEAAMVGQARNVLHWHRSHQHCGRCGSKTWLLKGGWKRQCTSCNAQLFPRTDPVVIAAVLSADGQRCLVGRQATWPEGRFSCLAGFMDPGETLEDAVRREVREESGVVVGDVLYHSSQPWPNGPSPQLMLGAIAIAETEALVVDVSELESARWLELQAVRVALRAAADQQSWESGRAPPEGILMPPPLAIAHTLLTTCTNLGI